MSDMTARPQDARTAYGPELVLGSRPPSVKLSSEDVMISLDPRRRELNRRHSKEMGALFRQFTEAHPDVEFYASEMTDEQEAAWDAFSAELFARHEAERAALAEEIEAERRQRNGG